MYQVPGIFLLFVFRVLFFVPSLRQLLHDLAKPPTLVFSDWDNVADNSRPYRVYGDANRDGSGATLEQEQSDGSARPILFIRLSTLDNEHTWTCLVLEAGSIIWVIK